MKDRQLTREYAVGEAVSFPFIGWDASSAPYSWISESLLDETPAQITFRTHDVAKF